MYWCRKWAGQWWMWVPCCEYLSKTGCTVNFAILLKRREWVTKWSRNVVNCCYRDLWDIDWSNSTVKSLIVSPSSATCQIQGLLEARLVFDNIGVEGRRHRTKPKFGPVSSLCAPRSLASSPVIPQHHQRCFIKFLMEFAIVFVNVQYISNN